MIAARLAEAVFLPGDPPRASVIALWHPAGLPDSPETPVAVAGTGTATVGSVELVLPAGSAVRRRVVEARLIPVSEALPWLVAHPADDDTPPSLAAWAVAARMGANLVARGRLLPAASAGGWDAWRAGPLDPDDDLRLAGLVDRFPPLAHALAVPGCRPLRLHDPRELIKAFWDAIADALARSPAATRVVTSPAFGAREPTDVSALRDWLDAADRGLEDGARPGLRLELPVSTFDGPGDGAGGAGDDDESSDAPRAEPDRAVPDEQARLVLQLRSHVDPSLVIDAADLWDASGVVLARLGEQAEVDLLLALRRGAQVWPPLQRALDDARPSAIDLDMSDVETLLGPAAADLAGAGFEVLWPATLTRGALSLRAVVTTESPAAVAGAGLELDQLCEFRWEALIDGTPLTPAELDALAEAKRPLVHLRGRWIAADPELLARLRRGPRRVRGGDALAAALGGTIDVDGEQLAVRVEGPLASLAERLLALDSHREIAEPEGLEGTLRPYQRRGLAWLDEMCALGLGGCLADDMGLGKTIQLIALHLHRHTPGAGGGGGRDAGGPTLVVCPTSLLGNWQRELRRFAPGVPVRRYHGGERHLDGVAPNEVVLVTYGVVRRDREALAGISWGLVAADEAQHVKNPFARTARELRAIPAGARLALTGTPVENRLSDLWSILDWTTPGLLGPLETFRRNVAIPVERNRDPAATERLSRLVRPFLLRRRKTDPGIAPELPPKTESDVFVPLTAEQITLYEAVVREALREIEEVQGFARRGLVLKLLTSLKQITNHPAQYLGQRGPLDGRSGKLEALDELLDVIVDEGDAVLVFTQYVQMARLLDAHLEERGIDTLFLHGGTSARRRDEMVSRFQSGSTPVFLLSLKAGGTGLNLTRATHVVHYDRWWNPAVEDQATDRAYRIGQDRPVQVHRLVTEGTVEDRVAQLLARKRELADAVVGSGEGWITGLSDDDLADLVSLQRDGWDAEAGDPDEERTGAAAKISGPARTRGRVPRGRSERGGRR